MESCCEIAWFRSGNCSNLGIPAKTCDNRLYFSLPEKIKQIPRNSWHWTISGERHGTLSTDPR